MERHHSPRRAPEARALCVGRSLHVIDIENMCGTSSVTRVAVAEVQGRFRAAGLINVGDHTVIAASHHNAAAMLYGWSGSAQRLVRSGLDGADHALLEAFSDRAWVSAHYARVVLASGDHIFAEPVAALKAAGVSVTVVPPDRGFSRALRFAAGPDIAWMPPALLQNVIALFPNPKDAA